MTAKEKTAIEKVEDKVDKLDGRVGNLEQIINNGLRSATERNTKIAESNQKMLHKTEAYREMKEGNDKVTERRAWRKYWGQMSMMFLLWITLMYLIINGNPFAIDLTREGARFETQGVEQVE